MSCLIGRHVSVIERLSLENLVAHFFIYSCGDFGATVCRKSAKEVSFFEPRYDKKKNRRSRRDGLDLGDIRARVV